MADIEPGVNPFASGDIQPGVNPFATVAKKQQPSVVKTQQQPAFKSGDSQELSFFDRALIAAEPYVGIKSPMGQAVVGMAELPQDILQYAAKLQDMVPGMSGNEARIIAARAKQSGGGENWGARLLGNVVGGAIVPGATTERVGAEIGAKGLDAAKQIAANLGKQFSTNAAQGAAVAGVTPAESPEQQWINMAAGAGFGGVVGTALPAAVAGVKKGYGAARGTQEEVGRYIYDLFNGDEAALAKAAEYTAKTPGVKPTLAHAALIPKVSQAERAQQYAVRGQQIANDAAYAKQLQSAVTPEDKLQALKNQRAADSELMYEAAQAQGIVSRSGPPGTLPQELAGVADRPIFSKIEKAAQTLSEDLGTDLAGRRPFDSVLGLQAMKRVIDNELAAKGGSSGPLANTDRKVLADVRSAIVNRMNTASPVLREADRMYAEASKPINAAETYNLIAQKAIKTEPEGVSLPVLKRAMLDELSRTKANAMVQQATGNRRMRLSDMLEPDQIAALQAVRSDMGRQARANAMGATLGSDTALKAGNLPGGLPTTGTIGKILDLGADLLGRKANLDEIRARAFSDPKFAQQLVGKAKTASEVRYLRDILTAPTIRGFDSVMSGEQ